MCLMHLVSEYSHIVVTVSHVPQCVFVLIGCRQLGSETEKEDIRHHQCAGGSGADREEKQEYYPVEV